MANPEDENNYGDANWGIVASLDGVPTHATNPNLALLVLNNETGYLTGPGMISNHGSPINISSFYQTNVTSNFLAWFAAGFIIQMVGMVASLLSCTALICRSSILMKFSTAMISCV